MRMTLAGSYSAPAFGLGPGICSARGVNDVVRSADGRLISTRSTLGNGRVAAPVVNGFGSPRVYSQGFASPQSVLSRQGSQVASNVSLVAPSSFAAAIASGAGSMTQSSFAPILASGAGYLPGAMAPQIRYPSRARAGGERREEVDQREEGHITKHVPITSSATCNQKCEALEEHFAVKCATLEEQLAALRSTLQQERAMRLSAEVEMAQMAQEMRTVGSNAVRSAAAHKSLATFQPSTSKVISRAYHQQPQPTPTFEIAHPRSPRGIEPSTVAMPVAAIDPKSVPLIDLDTPAQPSAADDLTLVDQLGIFLGQREPVDSDSGRIPHSAVL